MVPRLTINENVLIILPITMAEALGPYAPDFELRAFEQSATLGKDYLDKARKTLKLNKAFTKAAIDNILTGRHTPNRYPYMGRDKGNFITFFWNRDVYYDVITPLDPLDRESKITITRTPNEAGVREGIRAESIQIRKQNPENLHSEWHIGHAFVVANEPIQYNEDTPAVLKHVDEFLAGI